MPLLRTLSLTSIAELVVQTTPHSKRFYTKGNPLPGVRYFLAIYQILNSNKQLLLANSALLPVSNSYCLRLLFHIRLGCFIHY